MIVDCNPPRGNRLLRFLDLDDLVEQIHPQEPAIPGSPVTHKWGVLFVVMTEKVNSDQAIEYLDGVM